MQAPSCHQETWKCSSNIWSSGDRHSVLPSKRKGKESSCRAGSMWPVREEAQKAI